MGSLFIRRRKTGEREVGSGKGEAESLGQSVIWVPQDLLKGEPHGCAGPGSSTDLLGAALDTDASHTDTSAVKGFLPRTH